MKALFKEKERGVEMDSDFLLICRMKNGNEQAIDAFVRKYYPSILRYCHLHIHDPGYAEDATQETFVRLFRAFDTRRDDGNLRCWIYTVATHEALRIIGRRTDVVSLDDDEGEALAGRIADEAIDDAAEGDAILLRLQQAIHRLPTKQQLVFNLRYYSEMSYDEIAQVTGIPATSAKASFHVAKQKITEYMTAHEAR